MTRPPPQTAFEFMERGWRPSLMWFLVLTIALPFGVMIAVILGAYAYAVVKAVTTGVPVPYLLGGIEHLPWQYIAGGLGALLTGYLARGRQVVLQDRAAGGAPTQPPFAGSSAPSSGQTYSPPAAATPPVEPPIDDLGGPRPGGNWQ